MRILIDADACAVFEEIYTVARRYELRVAVVAKAARTVPRVERIEMVVRPGFGEVDDWIAEVAGPSDIVITTDIPLAARCLEKGAFVLDAKGNAFTDATIGEALAMRELMDTLRQSGLASGGPRAMKPKDRSRFLAALDEAVNKIRRKIPPEKEEEESHG